MSEKAEVLLELRDNYSETLKKVKSIQETFTKDLKGMQSTLNEINRSKAQVNLDVSKAQRELNAAKKAMQEFDDEMTRSKAIEAQLRYDTLKDDLKALESQAKSTRNEMEKLAGLESKRNNQSGGGGGEGDGALQVGSAIFESQLASQLFGSVSDYIGTSISSRYGASMGSTISTIGSNAISGAAAGFALGSIIPGIGNALGTAIGAAVGTISGIIQDTSQKKQEKDDLFRNDVQNIYNEVQSMRSQMLEAGSVIAAERESSLLSFTTLLKSEAADAPVYGMVGMPAYTKDGDALLAPIFERRMQTGTGMDGKEFAQQFLDRITEFSRSTPFGYDDLTATSKTLLSYGYKSDDIFSMLTQVGDAGAALGWNASDREAVATYLGRMNLTDKVTMQYLNPLMQRQIDVLGYIKASLEPSLGSVTEADVMEMISKGELSGKAVSEVLLEYMGDEYKGAMEEFQNSYEGVKSTLEDWESEMQAAMGKGYNDERTKQMKEQIDWYEQNADELKRMYELVGQYEAGLVGDEEENMRNSLDKLLDQIKTEGITDASQMSQTLYEAMVDAKVTYLNSDSYKDLYNSQIELVERVQTSLVENQIWYDFGKALGDQFTKGLNAALGLINSSTIAEPQDYINSFYDNGSSVTPGPDPTPHPGYAYGISYVPSNNYPAMLHEGERVLTAAQARAADRGGAASASVTITGNQFIVRQESDIDAIASALLKKLRDAELTYVED
ncbi:MAG: hypothetical protein J1E60_07070 [Christensenellaceae bacterium]|nr:hypothetical protein [Christensenellaceae bacterium]